MSVAASIQFNPTGTTRMEWRTLVSSREEAIAWIPVNDGFAEAMVRYFGF
jgi:hypothetical protein